MKTTIFAGILVSVGLSTLAAAAEPIEVPLGGAKVAHLPSAATQVVVGNPLIADVTVQSRRSLVVFGKYPGGTSLIALGPDGGIVLEATVVVASSSADGVTIHYGTSKAWTPGGVTAVAECSRGGCSPLSVLPTATPFKAEKPAEAAPAPSP